MTEGPNEKAYLRRVAMYALKCNRDYNRTMIGAGYGEWSVWYQDAHGQYDVDYRAFYVNLADVAKSMAMEGT